MKRSIEKQLKKWKLSKRRKPLILKGARQVGKTHILRDFGEKNFKQVHYINFERRERLKEAFAGDLDPKTILEELDIKFGIKVDPSEDLLIIDEIQECPRALTSLKYFCEDMPDLAVATAGSLLGVHLGESSFPVGKVDHMLMYPMSFEEFILGIGKETLYDKLREIKYGDQISSAMHSTLWDLLKIYFITGGLPEVIEIYKDHQDDLAKALIEVREKQYEMIVNYRADMAKHCGKENAMHLDRLWENIPTQLARAQDGSSSRFQFKDVIPEKNRYSRLAGCIDWLENAGLIYKAHIINDVQLPFLANAEENKFKLFIFDVGILGALNNLKPETILDYDYGTYKGYFAENFVIQEFIYSVSSPLFKIFSWTKNSAEIEFVREFNGKVYPIEVKSGNRTKAKSLNAFAERYKPEYRVKMSGKTLQFDEKNKIHNYPLYLAARFPLID